MEGLISVNGVVTTPQAAKIPALDRGFLFGDNVFEVFVAFHGKILDLEPHFERLRRSAEQLRIALPWSNSELEHEMKRLLEQLQVPKAYIRLVITRGSGLGLEFSEAMQPNRVIFAGPAKQLPSEVYTEGVTVKKVRQRFTDRGPTAKTGNYLKSILALDLSKKEGYDEILWYNDAGEITEAATANVFFIGRQGDQVEISTPPGHSGLLLGITRANLLTLLDHAQIRATEQIIFADEVARFDEAFICSTVRGLIPIARIDQHKLHTARLSSVYRQIERLYFKWVESEIGLPVEWNTGRPIPKGDRSTLN